MKKPCPCQFGVDDCSFPDCYTKEELVGAIEKKNTEIREIVAVSESQLQSANEALDIARLVIEEAREGLEWYFNEYPESTSSADDEFMMRVQEALSQITDLRGES